MTPTSGPRRTTMTDHKPRRRGNAEPLTRGHEQVAPGPPGRADGASGTAVTSGVMPLSACDRPVARPVARIARATRTPQSHATFT